MANNDIDFVQSAIDAELPAGISITCEYDDQGGVRVTGCKGHKTHTVLVRPGELRIVDSDTFIAAIRDRILDLRNELNGVIVKKPAKRKGKKKGKKLAARRPTPGTKLAIVNDALLKIGATDEAGGE